MEVHTVSPFGSKTTCFLSFDLLMRVHKNISYFKLLNLRSNIKAVLVKLLFVHTIFRQRVDALMMLLLHFLRYKK